MKSILLVCSAGMSTSLLVTKMEKAAQEKQLDITILAVAEAEASQHYDEANIVLLGPQVRFLKTKIEKQLAGKNIPVQVIDSIDYGTMNGEVVLTKALQIMA